MYGGGGRGSAGSGVERMVTQTQEARETRIDRLVLCDCQGKAFRGWGSGGDWNQSHAQNAALQDPKRRTGLL